MALLIVGVWCLRQKQRYSGTYTQIIAGRTLQNLEFNGNITTLSSVQKAISSHENQQLNSPAGSLGTECFENNRGRTTTGSR